jgi:uncharacterized phage protein (TIGR02220 family)
MKNNESISGDRCCQQHTSNSDVFLQTELLGLGVVDPKDSKAEGNDLVSFTPQEREEIVGYLNKLAGTHRKTTTKSTVVLLNRLRQKGYSVDEVKSVIKSKTVEWKNVRLMKKYLRPSTLFDPYNFRKYLKEIL